MILARALGAVAIVGFLGYPALAQGQTGQAELIPQDLEFAPEAPAMLLHVHPGMMIYLAFLVAYSRAFRAPLSFRPGPCLTLRDVCGGQALN